MKKNFRWSKTFPVREGIVFKLRGDAFNIMNHPVFNNPDVDITQSSNPFRVIPSDGFTNTTGPNFSEGQPRVLQVSLRLEF